MLHPLLVPDAFVRAYVGDRGWGHVLVRRVRAPRLWLPRLEHAIVERCDGERSEAEIAREAGAVLGRAVSTREVAQVTERLADSGAVIDAADAPGAVTAQSSPRGLASLRLDDARTAAMRLSLPPRFGFACDGRGGCCRLYDLVSVRAADVAALETAYGPDGYLPGGLTLHSAIARHRGDAQGDLFALAAVDGACVLLERDGRCGVHRLLGSERKPAGCAAYPLRDVLCGDELAIGVAIECRCAIELADAPSAMAELARAGATLLRRRTEGRVVEAVADEVPLAGDDVVPRVLYVEWRAAAGTRLHAAADVVTWALDEATRLGGAGGNGPSIPEFLARIHAPLRDVVDYLEFEARNTAEVYSSVDLQVALYAWAARAAARLLAAAEHARPPGPPAAGELLVAAQSLHTHDLLRAPDLRAGLLALAVRLMLARSDDGVRPPELLPVTAAQYLGRSSHLGRLLEDQSETLAAALAPPE